MDKRLLPHTEEHRAKISQSVRSWHHRIGFSAETKRRISSKLKELTGEAHPLWKPKKKCTDCSAELSHRRASRCMPCAGRQRRGENSYNFNGRTPLKARIRSCYLYRQWRSLVFERDSWTCQTCRVRGVYFEAHHIVGFSKILKNFNINTLRAAIACAELWDANNGVTLCEECHRLTKTGQVAEKEKK